MDSLKLSLERPYKDDNGDRIPKLLDIAPDGQLIYELVPDPKARLGESLARICAERPGFMDRPWAAEMAMQQPLESTGPSKQLAHENPDESQSAKQDEKRAVMTVDRLYEMRGQILPQLHPLYKYCSRCVTLFTFIQILNLRMSSTPQGEMSHAREFLDVLLPSKPSGVAESATSLLSKSTVNYTMRSNLPQAALSPTTVSKLSAISSVRAFNAQLTLGSKDVSLRKAASLLQAASNAVDHSAKRDAAYWRDALKVRSGNWGLIPAMPGYVGGHAQFRSNDRTAKDFTICYWLEDAPNTFKRRATAHLSSTGKSSLESTLTFGGRQMLRLVISYITPGQTSVGRCVLADGVSKERSPAGQCSLDEELRFAQQELVEREIFGLLMDECSQLPSASAHISERLIDIEVTQGVRLTFELTDTPPTPMISASSAGISDLIGAILPVMLMKFHSWMKTKRLAQTSSLVTPSLLQTLINFVQYQVFCDRAEEEFLKFQRAVVEAGFHFKMRFDRIGISDGGRGLVEKLSLDQDSVDGNLADHLKLSGEVVLRIDERKTLRLTMTSPATLIAHLPQAMLTLSSIPQLRQLLVDEWTDCLLQKACDAACKITQSDNTWFVDNLGSIVVGRMGQCIITIEFTFDDSYDLSCTIERVHRAHVDKTTRHNYDSGSGVHLIGWLQNCVASVTSDGK